MSKVKTKPLSDLFDLFSTVVSPADFIAAKLLTKISTAITKARLEKNMTQKEFAAFIGVSQGMVSKWESADYNYTIESLANICDKLNYDIDISISKSDAMSFSAPQYQQKTIKFLPGKNNINLLYKAG